MTLNRRRLKILELIREDGHAKVHDLTQLSPSKLFLIKNEPVLCSFDVIAI